MEGSKIHPSVDNDEKTSFSRKQFLKISGISAVGAAVGLSSCTEVPNAVDDEGFPPLEIGPDPQPNNYRIWIGRGDVALMNTIHIYVRIEEAFYRHVLQNPYDGMTSEEQMLFITLRKHETAHSDFLNQLLGESAIKDDEFSFNFGYFNFNNRIEIIKAAFKFENMGVAMYNHFPELLKRTKLVTVLSKLGSVEARQATSLQFLLEPTAIFVGRNGLDTFTDPLAAWNSFWFYMIQGFDVQGLPGVGEDEINF